MKDIKIEQGKFWYSENELRNWLKKNKYSDRIAEELKGMVFIGFNGAYRKGFEYGLKLKDEEFNLKLKEIGRILLDRGNIEGAEIISRYTNKGE